MVFTLTVNQSLGDVGMYYEHTPHILNCSSGGCTGNEKKESPGGSGCAKHRIMGA